MDTQKASSAPPEVFEFDTESAEARRKLRRTGLQGIIVLPLLFGALAGAVKLDPAGKAFPGIPWVAVMAAGSGLGLLMIAMIWWRSSSLANRGKWRIDDQTFIWLRADGFELRLRWSEVKAVKLAESCVRTGDGTFCLCPGPHSDPMRVLDGVRGTIYRRLLNLSGRRNPLLEKQNLWLVGLRVLLLTLVFGALELFYLWWLIMNTAGFLHDLGGGFSMALILVPVFLPAVWGFWRERWRFQWLPVFEKRG